MLAFAAPCKSMLGSRWERFSEFDWLPYDAEVEWLGVDSGYPYINTGWTPTGPFYVHAYICLDTVSNNLFMMGARTAVWNNGKGIGLGSYGNGFRVHTGSYGSWAQNPAVYSSVPFVLGEFTLLEWGCTGDEIYGATDTSSVRVPVSEDRGTSDWNQCPNPFCIFQYGSRILSTTYPTGLRIAHIAIYDGETLVRDLVPVRIGNEGFMYDYVTETLFGNQGTGRFMLGPDKE